MTDLYYVEDAYRLYNELDESQGFSDFYSGKVRSRQTWVTWPTIKPELKFEHTMEYLLWLDSSTISIWETLFELWWWTLSFYCRLDLFWNKLSHKSNSAWIEPFLGSWRVHIFRIILAERWLKLNSVNHGRTSELRLLRHRWWDTEIVCLTNTVGVN